MTFETESEAEFWRAVFVAYIGCPTPHRLDAIETADRAVTELRQRMQRQQPYVELTTVSNDMMDAIVKRNPGRVGTPSIISVDGRVFPRRTE